MERRRAADNNRPVTYEEVKALLEDHEVKEMAKYAHLLSAFPDENLAQHREYHARKIAAAQAEQEFWETAKQELLRTGMNGAMRLIGWVLALAALGFSVKYGLPIPFLGGPK